MAAQRPPRFSHKPGSFWYYNNWDFNTLGTIYERAVRSSIFDAFEREIARPIGMQDYRPADGEYVTGAGSVYPAYPFKMSARDLARFALLYLSKGRWQDRQIIPASWVEESARALLVFGMGARLRLSVVDRTHQQRRGARGQPPGRHLFRPGPRRPVCLCHPCPRFGCGPSWRAYRRWIGQPQECRPTSLAHPRRRQVSGHRTRCIARGRAGHARRWRPAVANAGGKDTALW